MLFAAGGGAVVFLGLFLERVAEWKSEKYIVKPRRRLSDWGWRILMVGIAIEIADAGWTAYEINNANPRNQPIKSIHADVFLRVLGTNFVERELDRNPKRNAYAELLGKGSPIAFLACDEFETEPRFIPVNLTNLPEPPWPTNSRIYSIRFSWPSADEFSAQFDSEGFPGRSLELVDQNNTTMGKLDEEMNRVFIYIPGITNGMEIIMGKCELTFNGSLQRKFSVLQHIDKYRGGLTFPIQGTNRP